VFFNDFQLTNIFSFDISNQLPKLYDLAVRDLSTARKFSWCMVCTCHFLFTFIYLLTV